MPDYVEDAELDARLSRMTLVRPGVDQPTKQASTLGRKPLPDAAFPQRPRIVKTTLLQISKRVYR